MTKARSLIVPAAGFFAAAAIIRFLVRHIESRVQILAFVALALVWEAVRRRVTGRSPSVAGFMLDAACATTAIIIVKCYTERIVI